MCQHTSQVVIPTIDTYLKKPRDSTLLYLIIHRSTKRIVMTLKLKG